LRRLRDVWAVVIVTGASFCAGSRGRVMPAIGPGSWIRLDRPIERAEAVTGRWTEIRSHAKYIANNRTVRSDYRTSHSGLVVRMSIAVLPSLTTRSLNNAVGSHQPRWRRHVTSIVWSRL
jgi:hypothetical protein